jgi:hypothetical protein
VLLLSGAAACADNAAVAPIQRQAPSSAVAATDPLSNANRLPPSLEQKVGRLRADLESRGYAVARGYWTLWGVDDCKYPIQVLGYCYGNNPTAPYALAMVPQWKDEFVDQRFHHVLTEPQRNMLATYRLDAQEALVILAELPPPARYFGIQTNVYSRVGVLNTADPIFPIVAADPLLQGILFGASPDPARRMLIASIGNSTNNVVMERKSGSASVWGEQRFFVITPDADVADAMTDALVRAGVPSANDILVEPVSPLLVNVGLDRNADDLLTYIRYALPTDKAAGERWRQQLPLTILRVRDTTHSRPPNPLPIPEYEQRSYNLNETVLAGDLQSLINAVRARWGQPGANLVGFFSAYKFLDLLGQHCLGYPVKTRGPMDCLGDTQDADYQISQSAQIDGGKVIAVVGTLATRTGNATYTSLSVNWFPQLVGVKNIDDTDLDGSAASFASALQHDASLFYVYYVARDCTGLMPYCVEVSTKLVPVGDIIKVIQRNYVNPGSQRGPDPNKLLNPVAIVLDGRIRPQ